jgi:hypothetical protein
MKYKCLTYNRSHIPTIDNISQPYYGCIPLGLESKFDIDDFIKGDVLGSEYDFIWIYGLDLNIDGLGQETERDNVNKFIEYINTNVKKIGTFVFDYQGEGLAPNGWLVKIDKIIDSINCKNYKVKILWNVDRKIEHRNYDIFYKSGYELVYWYYCNNILLNQLVINSNRDYLFSFVNGVVNGREHRYKLLKKLFETNDIIKSGLISNLDKTVDLPYIMLGDGWLVKQNRFTSDSTVLSNSYINLVSETTPQIQYPTGGLFITEKSIKPFIQGQIPIILGQPGVARKLQEYGFDMFADVIDITYDDMNDLDTKVQFIYDSLVKLKEIDMNELFEREDIQKRLRNNYDRYINLIDDHTNIREYLTEWIFN